MRTKIESPATGSESRGLFTTPVSRGANATLKDTATAADILARFDSVRRTGPDSFTARCSAHDDRRPSLSIKLETDRVLLHCFAGCSPDAVAGAVGLRLADLFTEPRGRSERMPIQRRRQTRQARPTPKRRVVREFDRQSGGRWTYTDEAGRHVATKYRTDFSVEYDDGTIGKGKTFRVEPKGIDLPLYRLPEVVSAARQSWPLYLLEGEAKADRISDLLRHEWGIDAVATSYGGISTFGRRQLLRHAVDCAFVAVVPDRDDAGQRHAGSVISDLTARGATVRAVPIAHLFETEVQQ